MPSTNPFKRLLPDLTPKNPLIPAEAFRGGVKGLDAEAIRLIRKAGVTSDMVRRSLEEDVQVSYDRWNLYSELERSMEHWFVGPAAILYANVATVFSPLQNCTVWVTSESDVYRQELSNLLDRIGTEEKILDWAHATGAYGDLFVKINGTPGIGVVSIEDGMHPMNLGRIDYEGILLGFYMCPQGQTKIGSDSGEDPQKLIAPWEYVHFRLLGARKKRPRFSDPGYTELRQIHLITGADTRQITTRYGTSLLTNGLPAYKRLRLAEDSLLLARVTRGIIRYIWKLKVSAENSEAVSALMDQYATLITRARAIDTRPTGTGPNYDDKQNPLTCLRGNTEIRLCDGRNVPIQEMAENPDKFIGRCVWSVNPETLHIEPKKILAARKTRQNAALLRVHLDNDKYVDCTQNHKFMLRDGSYTEAQYLQIGDSLMPFYTKIPISKKGPSGYECIYDPGDNAYHYAHCIVTGPIKRGFIRHHKWDAEKKIFDKLNNDPTNIVVCTSEEHMLKYHPKHTPESIEKIKKNQIAWLKGETKETCPYLAQQAIKHSAFMVEFFKTEEGRKAIEKGLETRRQNGTLGKTAVGKDHPFYGKTWEEIFGGEEAAEAHRQVCVEATRKAWTGRKHRKESIEKMQVSAVGKHSGPRVTKCFRTKFCDCGCGGQFREDSRYPQRFIHGHNRSRKHKELLPVVNHKVIRIEQLSDKEDVYDITVEGNHNFALTNGIFVHNCIEDIFVPIWGDMDLSQEKIGGEADIRWIVDIDSLRQQLAFSLATPLALGGAYVKEASGSLGSEAISKLDIRFARNARTLQRALIHGITRICQIHLAYMGMDPDPNLFEVHMTETSTAEEESLRKSLDIGMGTFTKLATSLRKIVGKKLDGEKLFNYYNEKVLRLIDFRLEDFYKSSEILSKEAEAQAAATAAKAELPAGEEEPKKPTPIMTSKAIQEVKVRVKHRPIENLDICSYLPTTAKAILEKCGTVSGAKGVSWIVERDKKTWKKITKDMKVKIEEVKK